MNNKLKVFLDFDSTIVDSASRFIEIANIKYGVNKNVDDLGNYSFTNLYPNITKKDIFDIFSKEEFFDDNLKYLDGAKETIEKYKDLVDFYISTSSSGMNLVYKKQWVKKNMPFIKDVLSSPSNDKSNIDMRNSIQIDDTYECLEYTNAVIKILFKDNHNYTWQKHDNDEVYNVNTWSEIDEMLSYYIKEGIN